MDGPNKPRIPRDDKLRADWSKKERDVMLHFPVGYSTNCDAHYLSGVFDKAFIAEMEARQYDLTTLRFEISPKAGSHKFRSTRPGPALGPEGGIA